MSQGVSAECNAMLTEISAYLDGDLGAAQCQAIERHCRTCARISKRSIASRSPPAASRTRSA